MTIDYNYSFHNDTPWIYECTLNPDENSRRIVLFLLYLFLFLFGLIENSVVVWVHWRRRHSASGVVFCILNMTLSDLMMVFTIPLYMVETAMDEVWIWGRFLCKVTHLVYVVNFYSSSFFLAFMTLERYLTLTRPTVPACFPLQPRHRRWLLCAGVWLVSFALALLENVHVDLLDWHEPGCYLIPENSFNEWFVSVISISIIFQFLGPASVIITCNVLIARAVRASPDVQNRRDLWLLRVFSIVFVACWLPYHVIMFMIVVDIMDPYLLSCNTTHVLMFSMSVVQCLSLFHCIANPILYNFLNQTFRSNLISDILSHISSPPISGVASAADGVGRSQRKERKLSNASTSVSELGS